MIIMDWIMLSLFGIAIIGTFIAVLLVGDRRSLSITWLEDSCILKQRIEQIVKKRNFFIRYSIFWMMINYSLSILSISANVMVLYISAYGKLDDNGNRILMYAIISLCVTISLLAVNPQGYCMKFRKSFRILDDAINKVESICTCTDISHCLCGQKSKCNEEVVKEIKHILENVISESESIMDEK